MYIALITLPAFWAKKPYRIYPPIKKHTSVYRPIHMYVPISPLVPILHWINRLLLCFAPEQCYPRGRSRSLVQGFGPGSVLTSLLTSVRSVIFDVLSSQSLILFFSFKSLRHRNLDFRFSHLRISIQFSMDQDFECDHRLLSLAMSNGAI